MNAPLNHPSSPTSSRPVTRRRFLGGATALVSAAAIVPRQLLGGAETAPPREKLNIAVIGTGGRGKNLIRVPYHNGWTM